MKPVKILNIVPIILTDALEDAINEKRKYCRQIELETDGLVQIEMRIINDGSAAINNEFDAAVSTPHVLELAQQAQAESFDAVVLDCFTDTALKECRELIRIPVIGPCQSACFLAMRSGLEFSVVCLLDSHESMIKDNLAYYGIKHALVSTPMLNIPVSEIHLDKNALISRITCIGYEAVKKDNAKSLILGCTGLFGVVSPVSAALIAKGVDIPIIEPFRTAVFDAVTHVLTGVTHSRAAYRHV